MTPAERAFWRLLADLTSEGKVLQDAGERLAAQFEAAIEAAQKKAPALTGAE